MYLNFLKPAFDFVVALLLLALLWPVLLAGILIAFFGNNGKVFFKQPRPGLHGKIFTIYKFRTMNEKRDAQGNLLPDAERLTPLGKFIRKTSLDELPQLFNVLKGDLSLVGPRPLLVEYLELYSPEEMKRHSVKPGITGWAQVNGRNRQTWEERFRLDLFYVNHISFGLDLKILFRTLRKIFRSHETSAEGHATMEKFRGSGKPAKTD
ncbi:sugar transferase [Adhaeribacter sp. BT258]|uniref:Sugar transferase n=1 Tax=Adhaeribacter terrigena TaxID=2793070 RepID=A0ABS1C6W5_9BACT|nr:sugar transferase [Adhaeribacter terrigena]MBK0404917.1 sugar transferase [Adhaeribacter terrigena]